MNGLVFSNDEVLGDKSGVIKINIIAMTTMLQYLEWFMNVKMWNDGPL